MKLEIDTTNYRSLFDLRGRVGMPEPGEVIDVPGGASITFGEIIERRGVEIPLTVEIVLTVGTGATSSLIANWLWSKLGGGRSERVRIDKVEITEITEEKFKRIVRETIERESE